MTFLQFAQFFAFKSANNWKSYNMSCVDLAQDSSGNSSGSCLALHCNHHHIFSMYVLADLLLLAVYLYGVYLFRSGEAGDFSYLQNLAARVSECNSG